MRVLPLLLLPGLALAQGFGPPASATRNVTVYTPDGGPLRVGIDDSARLDTNITNEYVPVAGDAFGARLEVAVPAGLAVTNTVGVTGSVELGPTSAGLLAGRTCTYGPIGHIVLDGGVQDIAGMTGRTGITLVAHAFGNGVDYVSCWPGLPDGGQTANCTVGDGGIGMPIHDHGSTSFDISNAYIVRCLTCNHSGGAGNTTALLGGANSQCIP